MTPDEIRDALLALPLSERRSVLAWVREADAQAGNKRLGRPKRKLSKADIERLRAFMEQHPYATEASIANTVGCGRDAWKRIREEDPRVREPVENRHWRTAAAVESSLLKQAAAGNVVACIWYEKSRLGYHEDAARNINITNNSVRVDIVARTENDILSIEQKLRELTENQERGRILEAEGPVALLEAARPKNGNAAH